MIKVYKKYVDGETPIDAFLLGTTMSRFAKAHLLFYLDSVKTCRCRWKRIESNYALAFSNYLADKPATCFALDGDWYGITAVPTNGGGRQIKWTVGLSVIAAGRWLPWRFLWLTLHAW